MSGVLASRSAALALFVLALSLRLLVIFFARFDGLYGQDAFAYLEYARGLWLTTQQWHAPAPFYWPLGYPALLSLAFAVAGVSARAAQWVSVLTGALVAPLIYLLTRDAMLLIPPVKRASAASTPGTGGVAPVVWSNAGPLAAGLVAALSGQLLQSSVVVMADAPATMWVVLSALALLRYARTRQGTWWFVSALILLFAFLTRWLFGALLVPWALVFVDIWRRQPRPAIAWRSRSLAHATLPLVAALPLLVVQRGAVIPSNSVNNAWLTGWNPLNALAGSFDNVDGHFDYPLPVGLFYAQPVAHPYYLFPLLLPLLVIGLWLQRRAPPYTLVLLAGWPLILYAFLMGIPYENFRFGLALWPPLVVLAGIGFGYAWDVLPAWRASHARRLAIAARPMLAVGLVVSLAAMLFWGIRGIQPIVAVKDQQLQIVRAVEAQVPPGSTIVTFGLTALLAHYAPDLQPVELYTQTPQSLNRLICTALPSYLLVEPQSIETQWHNREPDLNVRWLRERAGLSELQYLGSFTLYRISGRCA